MNWDLSPAQARVCWWVEYAEVEDTAQKPRLSNEELLRYIADLWRNLKRPPLASDAVGKRCTIARRFHSFSNARRKAYELLTAQEQAEYRWRCRYCGRDDFQDPRGLTSHERFCTGRECGGR